MRFGHLPEKNPNVLNTLKDKLEEVILDDIFKKKFRPPNSWIPLNQIKLIHFSGVPKFLQLCPVFRRSVVQV